MDSKANQVPSVTMSDGHQIPLLGLGTYKSLDAEVKNAIRMAITTGYRLIDTAFLYDNERAIGEALSELLTDGSSQIKRQDLFITTKVHDTFHSRAKVMEATKLSLANLGLDYVDLLLIHWPTGLDESDGIWPKDSNGKLIYSDVDYIETWQGMEDVLEAGLAKSIGVSNFNHKQLERILSNCKHKPVLNQVECHPYLNQEKLLSFCKSADILLQAYRPLGKGIFDDDVILKTIAAKHGKSLAQIAIRFHIQRGVSVIPKSVNQARIEENFNVLNFELNGEDMEALMKLDKGQRLVPLLEVKDHPHYPFNEEY